ncbi:MAG: ion channel DMI1 [Rhodothermia bacterium]|nr:ion channel DMI1 [Rhodothermia bacterium]
MAGRLRNRIQFLLERWIQRGALYQLLFMLGLIAIVAFSGGLLAASFTGVFGNLGEAVWWAFLRLTDPGYLGDDEGTALRVISTAVTVLGYVLFMGSLIAIMTQWLNQEIRRLESGLTPITIEDHFLILGWTNRTPSILRELVLSEGRVRRFLRRRGARKLRIVILADEVTAELRHELREILGRRLRRAQIILRSGSSMRIEHLRRVDYARASAIILPGADFALGGPEATDTRVVKTLMTISKDNQPAGEHEPSVVAEIFDAQKIPIAEQAYDGRINVIAGDAFISRLIAQTVRHRGLSHVYSELLSHEHGNEVYVRQVDELAGLPFLAATQAFPRACVLGVARPHSKGFRPILNPSGDFEIEHGDRIVLIAGSYEESLPDENFEYSAQVGESNETERLKMAPVETKANRRILVLGWSHKVEALIEELSGYTSESFELDVFSLVPADERKEMLKHVSTGANGVTVTHLEGDYVRQADLADIDWSRYDNCVFLGSDWLDSSEETDARSILGYSAMRAAVEAQAIRPEILIELIDPWNAVLFKHRLGEVIISPVVLSHMLAHASLRPELTNVFGELFGPGGAEIFFRPASDYQLTGKTVSFEEIRAISHSCMEIAIGVRLATDSQEPGGGMQLNPRPDRQWTMTEEDEIVVLTRYS